MKELENAKIGDIVYVDTTDNEEFASYKGFIKVVPHNKENKCYKCVFSKKCSINVCIESGRLDKQDVVFIPINNCSICKYYDCTNAHECTKYTKPITDCIINDFKGLEYE